MKKIGLFLILSIISLPLLKAQQTAFTVEDILNVRSLGSQTLSPNGDWLAGIISDGRARFGTDHFRFRDPSYLNIRAGQPVLINTNTGEQLNLFDEQVRITNYVWSPSGDHLFFYEQKEGKIALAYYDVAKKRVRYPRIKDDRILVGDDIKVFSDGESVAIGVRSVGWYDKAMADYQEATAGPIVVYDGNDDYLKWDKIGLNSSLKEVVVLNLKTGKVQDVLPESSYSNYRVSDNGRFLSYNTTFSTKTSYTRNDGRAYEVGFMDLSKMDSVRMVYERNNKQKRHFWSNGGARYALVNKGNVEIYDLDKFGEDPLQLTEDKAFLDEEKKKKVKFSISRWHSTDGKMLLTSKEGWWTVNTDGSDLKQVYELPDKEERDEAPTRNIVHWSADGKYLYVSYSEKEVWNRGIQRYNIESQEFEDLMTNANLYSSWRFAEVGDKLVYSVSDGDKPNNVFANNYELNAEKQLTDFNPWVANKKWTRSELITYRDVDGKELKGILYYPVDYDPNKKYPLVLEVYETFFNNGYRSSMNLIANQGYFGLRPSVDLERGYPGEAWMKGVTSAINKLVEEGKVDNDKVGIHGTSYGGYAASLLITQTDRFAAAINISGKVNIISFLGDSPKIGTRNYAAAEVGQDRIGGKFWDEPLKYFQTTAVLYADRIKTPHLLLTGEGDWNVPGTNTRELYYAMRRLGKDVTWVNYMRGGHGAGWASNESDYFDQWERMLTFYDKHFFPVEKESEEEEEAVVDQGGY